MNILWHSVHPEVGSGYGMGTKTAVTALREQHDMTISCSFGLQARTEAWHGLRVLPHGVGQDFGNKSILGHVAAIKPDLVFSLLDIWVFDPEKWGRLPWAAWLMIDANPLMEHNRKLLDVCRWPVAVTLWGQKVVQDAGYDCDYVPMMVDSETFHINDRGESRAVLGRLISKEIEQDAFMCCVNSANVGNPGRKNIYEILRAWAGFCNASKGSKYLFLHTDITGKMSSGVNIPEACKLAGVDPDTVICSPQWEYFCGMLGPDYLNLVYNASNCLLNPSVGEGFGLPAVEAQMAGCPAIVTRYGASEETSPLAYMLDGPLMNTGLPGSLQPVVGWAEIYTGLRWVQDSKAQTREEIRESVMRYSPESVMTNHMEPLLAKIEKELNQE